MIPYSPYSPSGLRNVLEALSAPIASQIREFTTGATRDQDVNKPDYEGFLSPLVIKRYGEYMQRHQIQPDGKLRDSDNWQKGIPLDVYIKSAWRHMVDWWLEHRYQTSGYSSLGVSVSRDGIEDALCALLFNVSGYLHETLKARNRGSVLKDCTFRNSKAS